MQLTATATTTAPHADVPLADEVLATFSYVIRGPQRVPHVAVIEARGDSTRATRIGGSFDDAVAAARTLASTPFDDGVHRIDIQPAQAVVQASDGAFWITPIEGDHRGAVAPLFIDGAFFNRTALSLQVARSSQQVAAIVGAEAVLDLRTNGAAHRTPPAADLDTPRPPRSR